VAKKSDRYLTCRGKKNRPGGDKLVVNAISNTGPRVWCAFGKMGGSFVVSAELLKRAGRRGKSVRMVTFKISRLVGSRGTGVDEN